MKIQLDPKVIPTFEEIKNKMLLTSTGKLMILGEFEITWEDVEHTTGWFRKVKTVTSEPFLTKCLLWGWKQEEKEWGVYTDDAIAWFVGTKDFAVLRQQYLDNIKAPINKLGHEIVHKDKIKE